MLRHEDAILIENIRRIIDDKGLKHCWIAANIGISREEFSRILSGKRVLRTCYIPGLTKALGVTANDLFSTSSDATKEAG